MDGSPEDRSSCPHNHPCVALLTSLLGEHDLGTIPSFGEVYSYTSFPTFLSPAIEFCPFLISAHLAKSVTTSQKLVWKHQALRLLGKMSSQHSAQSSVLGISQDTSQKRPRNTADEHFGVEPEHPEARPGPFFCCPMSADSPRGHKCALGGRRASRAQWAPGIRAVFVELAQITRASSQCPLLCGDRALSEDLSSWALCFPLRAH